LEISKQKFNRFSCVRCSIETHYLTAVCIAERIEILGNSKTSSQILEYPENVYDITIAERFNQIKIFYHCLHFDCFKNFDKPQNFLVHLRMHMSIKEYNCSYCSKKFTQKGNMRKHLKKHEIPGLHRRKTIKCDFCISYFTEKYNCQVGFYTSAYNNSQNFHGHVFHFWSDS
jgi:uncharacterized Zn-finger protein